MTPILRSILIFLLLILALGCLAPVSPAQPPTLASLPAQNAYYVAPDGNDGNPGTEAQPWATIQHAADVLQPGDTVYVRAGTYAEDVEVHVSGSETGGYITFRNYPGETPVLDGSGLTVPAAKSGLFYIEDQSYLIIQGFELRNYQSATPDIVPVGIHIRGNSHHIRLLHNHIHDIASTATVDSDLLGRDAHGIAVYGDDSPGGVHDLLIEDNELDHLTLGSSESLVLNGNVYDFTVRGNRVHDNDNIGIDAIGFEGVSPDPATDQARNGIISDNVVYNIDSQNNPAYGGERSADGIYVDGGTHITLERNRVHDSNIGIEIASEHRFHATSFITVTNNLVYWNHIGGLFMGGYDRRRGSTEDCTIVNNTFFENDSAQDGNGEILLQYDTRRNIIANNILHANQQGYLITNPYTENTDNVVDYNLYFSPMGESSEWQWQGTYYQGFAAWQSGTGNDSHGLFADPRFVDTSTPDLALRADSPAVDAGDPARAPEGDFLGIPRPQGAGDDMGAYEYPPQPVASPPTDIHILDGTTARLTWTPSDAGYDHFDIYRDTTPYFDPAGSPAHTVSASPWQWDDPDALGDPAVNHFYVIRGVRYNEGVTTANRVGEFDFGLVAGQPSVAEARGGYATGSGEDEGELAWMGRFDAVETGGVTDPLPSSTRDILRGDGVQTLFLYEWMPAGYHYTDGSEDDPFMQWAYTHRYTATLNADGPFPHCVASGYDWCEDYYYDLALPEVRARRVDYLVDAVQSAGYDGLFFDWATGGFLEEPQYASIRREYESRHPDIPYDQAVADFYTELKSRGIILHTNQGFRSAEYILPVTHYDMTESYVTDETDRGNQLYVEGQGLISIPETLYYPLSDDEYDGDIADTIDYLDYLADLRADYAGPDFIATVYMNYAAPDFTPTGAVIDGHDVYTATIPRNAIYWGTAIPMLLNQIAYTETPWDHRYERDETGPYFYDLGDPLGDGYETLTENGVTYYVRYYSNGIVLAGEWPQETTLTLSSASIPSHRAVYDAYERTWLTTGDHVLTVTLRPQAISPFNSRMAPLGRFYIYGD